MQPQLPLSLHLDDSASFDNFFVPDSNRLLLNELKSQATGDGLQWVFLHGAEGAGKSHLLQASARAAEDAGRVAWYLPLEQCVGESAADVLAGLEAIDLLCLDALHLVVGADGEDWERAIFNCYNSLLASGGRMLVAARKPPAGLAVSLADLNSRLQGFATFALAALDDAQRKSALRLRAECRGLSVSDDVVEYIFSRGRRDLISVFETLDHIDRQAMSAQRRLTVPFVRSVMGW